MRIRFRRRLADGILLGLLLLILQGCLYSFRAGAGFPAHIRTIAILPFENDTPRFELTQEVHQQLLQDLPRALGLRSAGEENADAVVRGIISNYTLATPIYSPGGTQNAPPEVHMREIVLNIRLEIVDVAENVILWESSSLSGRGSYLELTETEEVARNAAIGQLVQQVVDGAQSNW